MELSEETNGEVTIVAVVGRVDAGAARQFGERIAALIQAGRSRLLIEASRLDYIGSMGLRALLIASDRAAESRGRLVLCGITAPVRRVIDIGDFSSSLEVYPSREDALAELCAG